MLWDLKAKVDTLVPSPEAVWDIRSDVLGIRAVLEGKRGVPKRDEAIVAAKELSDVCGMFLGLLDNLKRGFTSKGYTQLATVLDMATVGSLALHDLSNGKWARLKDLMMSAFSEASMVLASVQYIRSTEQVLLAVSEEHLSYLYGQVWELLSTERKGLTPSEVLEVKEGLDGFFKHLRGETAPLEMRCLCLSIIYIIVIKVKAARLMAMLDDKALGP